MENTGALPTAASKPAIGDAFRFDINALRALSVVAVVGFHFQIPGFAGGFVGVDVFLVITGYLMTAKVLNELKLGRFSPWTFWMMRMRRIYPALTAAAVDRKPDPRGKGHRRMEGRGRPRAYDARLAGRDRARPRSVP